MITLTSDLHPDFGFRFESYYNNKRSAGSREKRSVGQVGIEVKELRTQSGELFVNSFPGTVNGSSLMQCHCAKLAVAFYVIFPVAGMSPTDPAQQVPQYSQKQTQTRDHLTACG